MLLLNLIPSFLRFDCCLPADAHCQYDWDPTVMQSLFDIIVLVRKIYKYGRDEQKECNQKYMNPVLGSLKTNNKKSNQPRYWERKSRQLLILYKTVPIPARMSNVTKSPRLAANGVAILSGLILNFVDNKITHIMTAAKSKVAIDAVQILPDTRMSACVALNWPSRTKLRSIAAKDASSPTTIACALSTKSMSSECHNIGKIWIFN